MAREQLGICTEANLHASYLLLNGLEGHERVLRYKLARLPALFDRLAGHFSEAMLTGVVAIGSNFWDQLYPGAKPAGLSAIPNLDIEHMGLAPVPIDLFIQIRSDRLDVNVIACQQVLQMLQEHVEIQEQLQGFRYLDGRNLTGFIDAPYNPQSRLKRQVALVDAEQQAVFAAGSYVYLQHLCFDQLAWQQLSQAEQEEVMGYDKVSAKPLNGELLLPDSHLALMREPEGASATVLMQNMPFYQYKRQGLVQVSYAATAESLLAQLLRRIGKAEQGDGMDLLLNYYRVELSAAFFAPSISFLELSANR
jgi:porphyrinogen peroxidase